MKNSLILVFLILIILLILGFVGWWFLPNASVVVYVSPRNLEETETVILDESLASANLNEKTLPAEVVKVDVSGEKTKSPSGSKVVGEKAKGKAIIRNGTANGIKLPSGTILVGLNDLKFIMDETASVSAAASPSSPGTATVAVSADEIGSEYNLAKDESFKVSNYPKSEVDAVAESDFGGGSSREVVVVSEKDLESLRDDLVEELVDQGQEQLKNMIGSEKKLIKEAFREENEKEEFSHKVGDEASSVKLNLSLTVAGVSVNSDTINELAQGILADKIPAGYVLREDQVENEFEFIDEDNGKWEIEVKFIANLLPETKSDEIIKKISGSHPMRAKEYLATIPGYVNAEIKVSPSFPGKLSILPRVKKHISIEVVAAR